MYLIALVNIATQVLNIITITTVVWPRVVVAAPGDIQTQVSVRPILPLIVMAVQAAGTIIRVRLIACWRIFSGSSS